VSQPKEAAPVKTKSSSIQQISTQGSGISFARKQNDGAIKAMGSKKLDIDFGAGDDFFNSF